MPGIQHLGQPSLQPLERQHLADGALGRVGNLRCKAQPGATPRASSPNALQRFGQFLSGTVFRATANPEQRAQQRVLDQARSNSRHVGDLLGCLTAPLDDAKMQQKIAQSLARLGGRSGGDLARLPGGAQALTTYLSELEVMDVNALRSGLLASPETRDALLATLEPPALRAQAESVLAHISAAVDQQTARTVFSQPLTDIERLLGSKAIDGAALEAQLGKLADHAAMFGGKLLDICAQSLSDQSLGALYRVLQGGKLDNARQAMAQIKDMHAGQLQRSEAMLERLRDTLNQEAQVRAERRLATALAPLHTAIAGGDRAAVGYQLIELSRTVGQLRSDFGAFLPESANTSLQDAMAAAMDALRDKAHNPTGPLTRDSLQQLDDNTLGAMRRSGAELRAYGLQWSKSEAHAESEARLEKLTGNTVGSAVDMLRTLAQNNVPPHTLVRQLHELSGLEFQRTQQLAQMGHYGEHAGLDSRRESIIPIMQTAIDTLRALGEDDVVQRATARMDLLHGLAQQYGEAVFGMGHLIHSDCHEGAQDILKPLKTMEHVLSGLMETLPLPQDEASKIRPLALPPDYAQAMAGQFGVRFDPDTMTSEIDMTDALRMRMAPFMDMEVPPDEGTHQTTLPVRGVDTVFNVHPSFFRDGIDRPSISLTVRGANAQDGTPVHSTWPRNVADEQRDTTMGEALDALVQVAGQSAEALTGLMHQQLGACILDGLRAMGNGSPFKLDDGTVVQPSGSGRFHFDVEKHGDGSFRLGATMHIPMRHATHFDAQGGAVPIPMNRDTSWAEVYVALHVSPDGKQAHMIESPRFGHHFEVVPE